MKLIFQSTADLKKFIVDKKISLHQNFVQQ
jgi:hypothetical protein